MIEYNCEMINWERVKKKEPFFIRAAPESRFFSVSAAEFRLKKDPLDADMPTRRSFSTSSQN